LACRWIPRMDGQIGRQVRTHHLAIPQQLSDERVLTIEGLGASGVSDKGCRAHTQVAQTWGVR
jgi:hypothetical protein